MSLIREDLPPSRWAMLTKRPRPANVRSMAKDKSRLYDNKLEEAYAQHLTADQQSGKILNWWPKPAKFMLANNCGYTPDFMVQELDGSICFHETKGFLREDAHLKMKFFVQVYPFPLWLITKEKCPGGFSWKRVLYVP